METSAGRARYSHIEALFDGEVAYLTLNRPPVNVIDFDMLAEIHEFLAPLADERRLCALAFQGKGRVFSAGVDVGSHLTPTVARMIREFHGLFALIDELAVPTVGLIQGDCLGGACELAGYLDEVLVTEKARFGLPEIKLGVFPPVAATFFPQRFLYQGAMQLLLTGDIVEASAAIRIGLASRLVPEEQALDALAESLRSFRQKSASALRATKRATIRARGPFRDLVAPAEQVYLEELMLNADAEEGLRAFLEKRDPVWTHE